MSNYLDETEGICSEKQRNLEKYFESLRLPEGQWLSQEALGLTDDDIRQYQMQKEQEVSMKPGQKRDTVIKEIVKPLLKAAGYRCKGNNWWKELDDGLLFIHLKSSQFNCGPTGCSFEFDISATKTDEIVDKPENQWIYNQINDISQAAFLPYWGMLSPNMGVHNYQIDGYRNYLPADVPVEEIKEQIGQDFTEYLLPELEKVTNVEQWEQIRARKWEEFDGKEIRILRFYSSMHSLCCSESNLPHAVRVKEDLKLTAEDIFSHLEWYEKIRENSSFPQTDAKEFMRRVMTAAE